MSLRDRSAVPFARLPDSNFFQREVRMLAEIAFEALAQTSRLSPVFMGFLPWQVHFLLREGCDLIVANVLSGHSFYPAPCHGENAMT